MAARQFGVITREQLSAAGHSRGTVERWIRDGHLHRLHRGVYALGHRRVVDHAHLLGALLSLGPDAFLSHRSAAAVWGLRAVRVARIEVTLPGGRSGARGRLLVHRLRRPPHPGELTTRNGLRVSSVPRLLVELAGRETPRELRRLVDEAARRGVLHLPALEDALRRHARRPGIERLRAAVVGYRPCPSRRSQLERAFDELLARHPEIPPPQRNVLIEGWEIDCLWPEQGVAVELDGRPYHRSLADMERDRLKDAKLLALGIRPLRITDLRFELDPAGALDDLKALLQLG